MIRGQSRAVAWVLLLVLFGVMVTGCARRGGLQEKPAVSPAGPSSGSADSVPQDSGVRRERCPITGRDGAAATRPVAIIVENSAAARPQSGLCDADVVYEALAEGGITRFLAIYHCDLPRVVGPVRSARPYFVVIAREWNAAFAHCGGDPKDLEPIKQLGVTDVDEMKNPSGFWRDPSRKPPHNLYTSVEGVRARAGASYALGSGGSVKVGWGIGGWAKEPVERFEIRYNSRYTVTYVYSRDAGGYVRFMNGEAHVDRETGRKVTASNVIVQFAESRVAYADLGLIIDLVGKGRAVFLAGGTVSRGSWNKAAPESPTSFLLQNGGPLELAPGRTWIEIVPADASVSWR